MEPSDATALPMLPLDIFEYLLNFDFGVMSAEAIRAKLVLSSRLFWDYFPKRVSIFGSKMIHSDSLYKGWKHSRIYYSRLKKVVSDNLVEEISIQDSEKKSGIVLKQSFPNVRKISIDSKDAGVVLSKLDLPLASIAKLTHGGGTPLLEMENALPALKELFMTNCFMLPSTIATRLVTLEIDSINHDRYNGYPVPMPWIEMYYWENLKDLILFITGDQKFSFGSKNFPQLETIQCSNSLTLVGHFNRIQTIKTQNETILIHFSSTKRISLDINFIGLQTLNSSRLTQVESLAVRSHHPKCPIIKSEIFPNITTLSVEGHLALCFDGPFDHLRTLRTRPLSGQGCIKNLPAGVDYFDCPNTPTSLDNVPRTTTKTLLLESQNDFQSRPTVTSLEGITTTFPCLEHLGYEAEDRRDIYWGSFTEIGATQSFPNLKVLALKNITELIFSETWFPALEILICTEAPHFRIDDDLKTLQWVFYSRIPKATDPSELLAIEQKKFSQVRFIKYGAICALDLFRQLKFNKSGPLYIC